MSKENNLLSIGKISKLTGASLRSLRYYEKLNLLKPAYIRPDTGYRYYSFEQSYLIEIIMLCIEMDIPLKLLTKFIVGGKTIDYTALLSYGKSIAQTKLERLNRGLHLIDTIEHKIAETQQYAKQGIYTRIFPQKHYRVIPCRQSFDEVDPFELAKEYLELDYNENDYTELPDYGWLCEHSFNGINRYTFMEAPKPIVGTHLKVIPAGTYFCTQTDGNQIEKAPQIFTKYLEGHTHYIAIETEIFTAKYNINSPVNELRVMPL